MVGISVEILVQCSRCWQPVAVNAFVPRVTCGRCDRPLEMTLAQWQSLLGQAAAGGVNLPTGRREERTMLDRTGRANLTYERCGPRCEACGTELPLAAALEQSRATNGWAGCPGCGAWIIVRSPGTELLAQVAPGVVCLVGEDPAQLPGAPAAATVKAPDAARAVTLPCPQCHAALPLSGSSRTIVCQYCQTSAYLPDDVWKALHPPLTTRRWYLVYDDASLRTRNEALLAAAPPAAPAAAADPARGPLRLEVHAGSLAGQTFTLQGKEMSIGRSPESAISVPSSTVARKQARLFLRDGAWWIEDLGGANGTQVNGERIHQACALRPGDRLAIGDNTLMFMGAAGR